MKLQTAITESRFSNAIGLAVQTTSSEVNSVRSKEFYSLALTSCRPRVSVSQTNFGRINVQQTKLWGNRAMNAGESKIERKSKIGGFDVSEIC